VVWIHLAKEKNERRFVTRGECFDSLRTYSPLSNDCYMESPLCNRCVASSDVRRSLFWVTLRLNGLDMKGPQSMQTYFPDVDLHLFRLRFKAR
jgi:hypothetical protein